MGVPQEFLDCAATVLEADPRLARALGEHNALAVGHAALLPVLVVPAGPWQPPPREALGERASGLAILSGLLVRDGVLVLGPGDLADPWIEGSRWVVCSPVRLAVVGAAFADAIAPWPDVTRLAARPRAAHLGLGGSVLDVLWRLGGRWGLPGDGGLALPDGLDHAALAHLTALPERALRAELSRLEGRDAVVRRGDGAWVLPSPPHDRPVRERLQARMAEQCALARLLSADTAAMLEEVRTHM
jgi:hypothetical protein